MLLIFYIRLQGSKENIWTEAGSSKRIMKFHSEELHNLYTSPRIMQIKSRRMRLAGHVECMGEDRKVYNDLVGKRPLRRLRPRWEDEIRMDRREMSWRC
jgi:hypothetical protein